MQSTGTLTVRVYTSQAQIPLKGATVVATAPGEGGKRKLLTVQSTNSSGTICPVRVDTPTVGESAFPHAAGAPVPFAVCDVWAEHPGYGLLHMEGVQIFPGVETVQNIEMVPLSEGQSSLQQRAVREITPQSL